MVREDGGHLLLAVVPPTHTIRMAGGLLDGALQVERLIHMLIVEHLPGLPIPIHQTPTSIAVRHRLGTLTRGHQILMLMVDEHPDGMPPREHRIPTPTMTRHPLGILGQGLLIHRRVEVDGEVAPALQKMMDGRHQLILAGVRRLVRVHLRWVVVDGEGPAATKRPAPVLGITITILVVGYVV